MNPLQLIPPPYRILAGAIALLLTIAAIFSLGWSEGADRVQAKWDKAKAVQVQAAFEAEQAARVREQSMISQIRKAENDANDREKARQSALAAASATDDRLRLALNTIRNGLPGNTAEACRATADAAARFFGECVGEYRAMAKSAAGYGDAAQTMSDAWPK